MRVAKTVLKKTLFPRKEEVLVSHIYVDEFPLNSNVTSAPEGRRATARAIDVHLERDTSHCSVRLGCPRDANHVLTRFYKFVCSKGRYSRYS